MNSKFALTLMFILFVGFSSASVVQELFSATDIEVTINQNESTAVIDLDTDGLSFDHLENGIEVSEDLTLDIAGGLYISTILSEINAEIEIFEGDTYPVFTSLSILPQGGITQVLFNQAFDYLELGFTAQDINEDISIVNNYLDDYALENPSSGNSRFTKDGTEYIFWSDSGYGDLSEDYKTKISEKLEENLLQISLDDLITRIVPFLEEEISNLDEEDFSLLGDLDFDYSVESINLSEVKLKDGNYTITAVLKEGSTTFTKEITLILEGVTNFEEGDIDSFTHTFVPVNAGVKSLIKNMSGFDPANSEITISIFNDGGFDAPENASVFTYLDMSVNSNPNDSAIINFYIPKTDVTNTSRVSLYVYEGSEWTKENTPTVYIGESGSYYEFQAFIPHFSSFMIAEDISISEDSSEDSDDDSSSSSSSSSRRTSSNSIISGTSTNSDFESIGTGSGENTLDLSGGSDITGAATGSSGNSGTLIVLLVVLIAMVVVAIAFRPRK